MPLPCPVQREAFGGSWTGPTPIPLLRERTLVLHAADARDEPKVTDAATCPNGSFARYPGFAKSGPKGRWNGFDVPEQSLIC